MAAYCEVRSKTVLEEGPRKKQEFLIMRQKGQCKKRQEVSPGRIVQKKVAPTTQYPGEGADL